MPTNAHAFFSVLGAQAEDPRLARSRMGQAEQHLDGRGFAAAVAAQEAVDRAALDRKVNPVYGRFPAVNLLQVFGLDDKLRHIHLLLVAFGRPFSRWFANSASNNRRISSSLKLSAASLAIRFLISGSARRICGRTTASFRSATNAPAPWRNSITPSCSSSR